MENTTIALHLLGHGEHTLTQQLVSEPLVAQDYKLEPLCPYSGDFCLMQSLTQDKIATHSSSYIRELCW